MLHLKALVGLAWDACMHACAWASMGCCRRQACGMDRVQHPQGTISHPVDSDGCKWSSLAFKAVQSSSALCWAANAAPSCALFPLQVERYKQLLLKQRDIMIALTQRLTERDEQILSLQAEIEAYDSHQRCVGCTGV